MALRKTRSRPVTLRILNTARYLAFVPIGRTLGLSSFFSHPRQEQSVGCWERSLFAPIRPVLFYFSTPFRTKFRPFNAILQVRTLVVLG